MLAVTFRVADGAYAIRCEHIVAVIPRVELRSAGKTQFRDVQTAYSYAASNDPRAHFGLGSATTVDSVRVRWLDGTEQDFGALAADRYHELRR